MLRIKLRGNFYHVRGTVDGERIRQSTKTADAKLARKVADKIEAEVWERRLRRGGRQSGSFAEAVNLYIDKQNPCPADRRRLLRLLDHFGRCRCDEIDQVALDACVAQRHPGAKPATIIRETITPLKAVLQGAARRKWCDPPDFERPKVEQFDGARALTHEEASRLVQAAAPHLKPTITFLLGTGARIGDALRLRWSEVNLPKRRVTFLAPKGGKPYTVPLLPEVLSALANLPHRDGVVFRTPSGTEYYDNGGLGGSPIKTGFNAACRRAGIGCVRVHDLRHTFTTWRVKEGVPLATVAKLRGDRGLQMVMRYTHLNVEDLAAAQEHADRGTDPAQSHQDVVQPTEKKG